MLATSGASALLSAAATDAWQGARSGIIHLFRRGGPRRQELASELLDADAHIVERADPANRDQVRHQLLSGWQTRLADLLQEFSDDAGSQSAVATELDKLVKTIQEQLPTPQQKWVQNVTASAPGAIAQGVMYGGINNWNTRLTNTQDSASAGSGSAITGDHQ